MAEQAFVKENPGRVLSISKLANLAGVNRSNIYTSHGEVVQRLTLKSKSRTSENILGVKGNMGKIQAPKVDSVDYKEFYHAMLRLNIELNAELASVKIKLEEKTRALKARRGTKV